MYKSVIEFSRDIPLAELSEYTALINKAFDNRGGKVENSSDDPYLVIHKADDNLRICLDLALITIVEEPNGLYKNFKAWDWIDEDDPRENGDIIKSYERVRAISHES